MSEAIHDIAIEKKIDRQGHIAMMADGGGDGPRRVATLIRHSSIDGQLLSK